MKNVLMTALLVLMASSLQAQWWGGEKIGGNGKMTSEKRNVGSFEELSAAGFFDVKLIKGQGGKITLEGEENLLKYIETEVRGDELEIKVEDGYSIRPSGAKKITVTVYFDKLEQIAFSGSGSLECNDVIEGKRLEFDLAGSGDAFLNLAVDQTDVSLSGSGNIALKGSADSFEANIAGSGDIDAYQLRAKNVEVSIAGSGDAKVYCNGGILKVNVAGSGDVYYKGDPDKEDTSVIGSGRVKKAD